MQAAMNAKVNPDWVRAGYPFLRAVVVEGVEAMEHHGWKWWKSQSKEIAQLQMELVDIWHFMLSHLLINKSGDQDDAAQWMTLMMSQPRTGFVVFDGQTYELSAMDTVQKLELLVGLSVVRRLSIELFDALLTDCEMSWDDLARQYVMKNVLNFFRQDNGYKEGSYIKEWAGREDNEHLVEIVEHLDPKHPDFKQLIYTHLQSRYIQFANAGQTS